MQFKFFFLVIGLLFLVATESCAIEAADMSASQRVEQLHDVLLYVMKNADRLGYKGRYNLLSPIVKSTYDLPTVTRLSVGSYWRNLAVTERKLLIDAVTRLTIATYASRFSGYKGQRFKIISEKLSVPSVVMVQSRLSHIDKHPILLDYILRNSESGWRVIDVFLQGKYSELARQRSEYISVIGRSSINGLIQSIDKKIAHLKNNRE